MRALAGGAAIASAAGVLTAVGTLIYLGIILGDRGLTADANGTSGYTTATETTLLIGSFIAIPLLGVLGATSLVFWIARYRADRTSNSSTTP
ncbi:hypothetical protein BWO91_14565 [Plantibacter flavus]|uniref:hypothetical protein n=1 Tax=Plantibacter TaxID=190323 RepID=UPI00099E00D2|nr:MULTISPECIES: hypothetical protein [Plantibacter]AQX81029.1 hypothetical protein BWO91_14565 [Plantibacter flavus]